MYVDYLDHMGSDLSVVNAARVSFAKESDWERVMEDEDGIQLALSHKDARLVFYLAKHKHLSPFGHCFASFRVCAPIYVARQLVKHKFLRWNEVSRRYVDDAPTLHQIDYFRGRAESAKQGSSDVEIELDPGVEMSVYRHQAEGLEIYSKLIGSGVAPEQARSILPLNTMTEWIWSGSLDAFAAMCVLRLDDHTQSETREVAKRINEEMEALFPVSWEALMENYSG
jgi:thymidylate synthase (FAD)